MVYSGYKKSIRTKISPGQTARISIEKCFELLVLAVDELGVSRRQRIVCCRASSGYGRDNAGASGPPPQAHRLRPAEAPGARPAAPEAGSARLAAPCPPARPQRPE